MKKTLILLSLIFTIYSTKAQTGGGVIDTLVYLKSIVTNKAQYIGQPFSVLSNSLQILIKHFSPYANEHACINKETSTGFAFYFLNSANEVYLTYPELVIKWQTGGLNKIISRQIWNTNNGGMWLQNAASFYNNAIIADIYIIE
jgi:hypothetical protein